MFDLLPDDASARPLADALPQLSHSLAMARNRVLATLDELSFLDGRAALVTRARLLDEAEAGAGILFSTPSGPFGLFPRVVEGVRLDPEADDAAVLATMDRLEPLIAWFERVTAEVLVPSGVTREPGAGLCVLLQACADGQVVHEAVFLIPQGAPERWPEPSQPDVARLTNLAVPLLARLRVDVGVLRAQALRQLRPGDMVLVRGGAGGAWAVELEAAGMTRRARLDPSSYIFSVPQTETDLAQAENDPGLTSAPAEDEPAIADVRVPVQLMVGEVSITLSELSLLRPGSTLVLEGLDLSSPATLLAGGTPIGSGRLVAVGQTYGLILDRIAGRD